MTITYLDTVKMKALLIPWEPYSDTSLIVETKKCWSRRSSLKEIPEELRLTSWVCPPWWLPIMVKFFLGNKLLDSLAVKFFLVFNVVCCWGGKELKQQL